MLLFNVAILQKNQTFSRHCVDKGQEVWYNNNGRKRVPDFVALEVSVTK